MRALLASLCLLPLLFASLWAAEPPPALNDEPAALADASLHAVRFVDANEGWACGDDGLILHTIDGGKSWDRQPSGVRASLRDLHFVDAFTGFCVGREELPYAGGSAGVILYTDDGGVKWRTVSSRGTPGLFGLRFADDRTAYLLAEASDAQPSGLFESQDGGASWKMTNGERRPGWFCGAFREGPVGLVGGPAGLMQFHRGNLLGCETPPLDGRAVRAVVLDGSAALAAGDRGLLLRSANRGIKWTALDLGLPPGVQEWLDFRSLCQRGNQAWLVGRPGSVVVHTKDNGQTWQLQPTGQNLPLTAVTFFDDKRGWAVGAAGVVVATEDGGQSWQVRRRGAARAGVLVLAAQAQGVPLGTIASLAGDDGYIVTTLQVGRPDDAATPNQRISAAARLHEATRRAGGCAGEVLSAFPLPQHLAEADAAKIAQAWGEGDEKKGLERLEAQLILALRIWQPEVVLVDGAEPRSPTGSAGALIALAAKSACEKAGKNEVAALQASLLRLPTFRPAKLYAAAEASGAGVVTLDLDNVRPLLGASASDFTATARPLLRRPAELPDQLVHYRPIWSKAEGAEQHNALMQGTTLERGGQARRPGRDFDQGEFEAFAKHSQDRREIVRRIRDLAKNPDNGKLAILAVEQGAPQLDEDAAGEAVFQLGQQFAALGHWPQAREVFLMMLDRYPSHRLAAEANRWFIAYAGSGAAKRRDELKQFPPCVLYDFKPPAPPAKRSLPTSPTALGAAPPARPPLTLLHRQRDQVRQWFKGSLTGGELLAVQGPLAYADPRVQFGLQASRRQVGEADQAQLWFTQFMLTQAGGAWLDAASAELWLAKEGEGGCPKPLAEVRRTATPPLLDGKFNDPCWLGVPPLALKPAVGAANPAYTTDVRLAHDDQFLYVAIQCRAPKAEPAPARKPRVRDEALEGFDRVTLILDVDRGYVTPYRLELDQRGCAREDCWGDGKWNPKWFIHTQPNPAGGWMAEASIPLAELAAAAPKPGETWCFNAVRTLPGKGVQAFSLPADVEPRLEGMGLLRFVGADGATK